MSTKTSPADHQLATGPTLLTSHSHDEPLRTICKHEPEALSAQLLDEALKSVKDRRGDPAPITSKEVAGLLGVSESLVNRWRSVDYREGPSFIQILRLPPSFHIELHRAMNRRFGFGRQLLRRVLDDLSDLALVIER